MQSTIELYIENYDVHMYDEDQVFSIGNSPTYQEIQNAINRRGVIKVAIHGYSHGGGSTWELSRMLELSVLGIYSDITLPFTVPFTSYIDAITDSWIGAENRRPPLSPFHVNQYQLNRVWISQGDQFIGGPSGGDDDIDRSYLNVVHTTVDDHSLVLDFLLMRIRQRVVR